MNKKLFIILTSLSLIACSRGHITLSSESLPVSSAPTSAYTAMENYLAPYATALGTQMDSILSFTTSTLEATRPEGTLNNLTADIMLRKANSIVPTDIALTNVGGLRKSIQQGPITLRDIYEVMPFDNQFVLLTLSGSHLLDLCQAIVTVGGEAISGLTIVAEGGKLTEAKVQGIPIDINKNYTIATSDYLALGNDKLTPLSLHTQCNNTGLLLRDVFIEGFAATDTISQVLEGRIIIK